jgi:hypothetical protein
LLRIPFLGLPQTWNGEPIPYRETVEVLRTLISTYGKAGPAIRALAEHPDSDALEALQILWDPSDFEAVFALGHRLSRKG